MSTSLEQDVRCPCGEEFEASLWTAVNGGTEPELREEILAGQLNVVRCPKCGQMIYAERFLLYHEPERELLAFVYPKDYESEAEKWRGKTVGDFDTAQSAMGPEKRLGYRPISVFGLDDLVEVLREDEEAEDQDAVAASLAVSADVELLPVRRTVARERHWPRRVPLAPGESFRDRLAAGLRRLVDANDRLSLYAGLLRTCQTNAAESSRTLRDIEDNLEGGRG
jgi:hypothetical protein